MQKVIKIRQSTALVHYSCMKLRINYSRASIVTLSADLCIVSFCCGSAICFNRFVVKNCNCIVNQIVVIDYSSVVANTTSAHYVEYFKRVNFNNKLLKMSQKMWNKWKISYIYLRHLIIGKSPKSHTSKVKTAVSKTRFKHQRIV